MEKSVSRIAALMFSVFIIISACSGGSDNNKSNKAKAPAEDELTQFQLENGIGPITEAVTLPEKLDPEKVKQGEKLFEMKCSACHKMDDRYVGPPLAEITDIRTPAYIMNMILNPEEMIKKHPIPKALLGEYYTRMTNQHLTEEQARAVVEYLASEDAKE